MRATLLLTSAAVAGLAAYYGEPFIKDNSDALLILVTVMTVFAGFLVAIVTILGDPSLMPQGSWRVAEGNRNQMEGRLIAHVWLFGIYLAAIALMFIASLLKKAPADIVSDEIKVWISRSYLFVGVFSFLVTFALPISLLRLQRARIDAEIEQRRESAGIKPDRDGVGN
jgi:hypothetical protein